MNNALCGIFDAVAKFLSPFMIDSRFGRRGTLCFLFVSGGIACIGAMVLSLLSGCTEIVNGECALPEKVEKNKEIKNQKKNFLTKKIFYLKILV